MIIFARVVMYYTPGHLCSGGVVHHYSYQSAQFDENHTLVQFDENYTLVQFVETIIWFNLMKLFMFFKLMGKMCVAMVINIDPIPLCCNGAFALSDFPPRHRRPFQAERSEGIGRSRRGGGEKS